MARLPGFLQPSEGRFSGAAGKTSGKVVVFTLFAGAFLLFGILFTVSYRQKLANQAELLANNPSEFTDSAVTAESVRQWMSGLPGEWVKVTLVEGQGYVLFTPCYSPNASLTLKSRPDSLPRVTCEYCDSLGEFTVRSIGRARRDSAWEFRLESGSDAGKLRILPVNDSLLRQFPEAPFREKLLIWTRSRPGAKSDTLLFIPKTQEAEFEALKAEDENPEGCGSVPAD